MKQTITPETFQQYLMRKRNAFHINAPKAAWDAENRGENTPPGRNAMKRQQRAMRVLDRLSHIKHTRLVLMDPRPVPKLKRVPEDIWA